MAGVWHGDRRCENRRDGRPAGSPALAAPTVQRVEIAGQALAATGDEALPGVTVIRAADLARAGITTAELALRRIVANQSGQGLSQGMGAFTGAIAEADLRGLGADKTLVLLDGRRLANHAYDASAVDLHAIPMAAVDRIEVLREGASAQQPRHRHTRHHAAARQQPVLDCRPAEHRIRGRRQRQSGAGACQRCARSTPGACRDGRGGGATHARPDAQPGGPARARQRQRPRAQPWRRAALARLAQPAAAPVGQPRLPGRHAVRAACPFATGTDRQRP